MVERAIALKDAYQSMCISESALSPYRIFDNEWDYLKQLCKLLRSFEEMTKEVSASQSFPTINRTIIIYNSLIDHLEEFIDNLENDVTLRQAAIQAKEKLLLYYSKTDSTPIYAVATAMDPRMKFNWWRVNDWGEYEKMSQDMVKSVWKQHYEGKETPIEPDPNVARQMKMYGIREKPGELDEFTNEGASLILCDHEPAEFMYWRAQSERWPNLGNMARDYLAIPATSTPCERCFSQAKFILPPQRNRLLPSTIKRLVLLDSWMNELKQ